MGSIWRPIPRLFDRFEKTAVSVSTAVFRGVACALLCPCAPTTVAVAQTVAKARTGTGTTPSPAHALPSWPADPSCLGQRRVPQRMPRYEVVRRGDAASYVAARCGLENKRPRVPRFRAPGSTRHDPDPRWVKAKGSLLPRLRTAGAAAPKSPHPTNHISQHIFCKHCQISVRSITQLASWAPVILTCNDTASATYEKQRFVLRARHRSNFSSTALTQHHAPRTV